jgi:ribosome biogenesis protein MAK21
MQASMPGAGGDDDGIERSIDDSELDGHATSNAEGDQDGLSESAHDSHSDGGFSFRFSSAEASDTDDLAHLDAEVSVDLTNRERSASATQESSVFGDGRKRKRKVPGNEDSRIRKKKLRALPTFASYEDFAQIIENEPEENV